MWWYDKSLDDLAKSPLTALRSILHHCGVLPCTPHSSRLARLVSGAFYVKKPECPARKSEDERPSGFEAVQRPSQNGFFFGRSPVRTNDVRWRKHGVLHGVVHTDSFLTIRRQVVLHSCFVLLVCVIAGCGYHFRADGKAVGVTLENLAIPLFTSTSTDIGFEAGFTRIIREEFISYARVPLVPEEGAHTVLIGRIVEIRTDPIGYDSRPFTVNGQSGTFPVTNTRRLKIRLDVQLIDRIQGKVIWHDPSIEERTSFQVETNNPLATRFYQEQAVEKLARRAAKKIYQRTLERF